MEHCRSQEITAISATGNGNINATNGYNINARGIIYWLYNNHNQVTTDANVKDVSENGSPDFDNLYEYIF